MLDAGRIKKFASDGTFLTEWGSHGTGDGQFDRPARIAADSAGGVWVTDGVDPSYYLGTSRIQHFPGDGTFLAKWSELSVAVDITPGATGDPLLADRGTPVGSPDPPSVGRVQKLLGDGTLLAMWDAAGRPSTPGACWAT